MEELTDLAAYRLFTLSHLYGLDEAERSRALFLLWALWAEVIQCDNLSPGSVWDVPAWQGSASVRVIAKRVLMQTARGYVDCVQQAESWYRAASAAHWQSLAEVRAVYPHADLVGDKTVFNLKGNDYRLIVYINCQSQIIYIKDLLSHAAYDRGGWQ